MDQQRPLSDRYALCGLLGRGGMAEVHQVRDLRLNRTVAVKILRADLTADLSGRERFHREAQSAAALNHPGIVAVFDTGEDVVGGVVLPFIVMEYVPGSTLSELLDRGEPIDPERAVRITMDVLDALSHAHGQGIVHRDIKPANVMLAADGTVKVMDFGIAHSLGSATGPALTRTDMFVGTASYLSPEQGRGEPVDARSDLYSTGCLLYELLTGRPPFIADGPMGVVWMHLHEEPPAPSTLVAALPPALDFVVLTALSKDRDQRFGSAEEMRAALEAALFPPPTTAVPEPTSTTAAPEPAPTDAPAPRRRRRRTGRLRVALAVCLVLATGATAYTVTHQGGTPTASLRAPDLTGVTVLQARESVQNAGLRIGDIAYGDCPVPHVTPSRICAQHPAPGTLVARGTAVTVRLPDPRRATASQAF